MDTGMDRERADRLASVVRSRARHEVRVVGDGDYFAVEVVRGAQDNWTLYDESDWEWLRDQITS